jgi:DNA-binding NtrC family response regulator
MDEEVVILSDDTQGRTALGVALADQGYAIHLCGTTTEATTLVASAEVGVLLIDCTSIPVDDGLRLARDCRARHPTLRCLVICNTHSTAGDLQASDCLPDLDPADRWLHILQQPYSMVRFAMKMREIVVRR